MGDTELAAHLECLLPGFAAYNIVDRMPDEMPVVIYPRTPGSRPERRGKSFRRLVCEDQGRRGASGKLKGKTVVVKDNICLAACR